MNSHQTSKDPSRFGNSHIHYKIVCSKIVDANVNAINNSYQIPSKLTKLRRHHFPGSTLLKVKTHLSSINNINWISVFIGSISFWPACAVFHFLSKVWTCFDRTYGKFVIWWRQKFVQLRADGPQVSGAFLLFIKKDAFNYT